MATVYPVQRHHSHSIHGILAAYPLAFFSGALLFDVVYANSAQMQWANFAVWLITLGLIMGVLAGIAGIVDALLARRRGQRRTRPWAHTVATALMMIVALINAFIHSRDAWTSVVPTGLVLSAITMVLALVSAWLGYSLDARQEAK